MPPLKIALFGGIHVQIDDQPVTLAYDKVRALLAFLLSETRQPHRREKLAGLLWPEQAEKVARHSLSQALLKLRRVVDSDNDVILADRHTVGLNPAAQFEWDTAVFTTLLHQCQTHPHGQPDLCSSCMARRVTAVSLYTGPFLAGLSLPDAPQFEQWLTQQREQYHRQIMDALGKLAAFHEKCGELSQAIEYAQQQLAYEPWLEETHRRLMMLFARSGQRSRALKQAEQCRSILQQELNTDLSHETETLTHQIKLRPNFSLQNLPVALTPFIGREQEIATLTSWLQETAVRLITITGLGGMGKTRLALAAAGRFLHAATSQPVAPFADGIYFIDLVPLTAPDQMETAVAEVLHVQLGSGNGRSPRQQLIDYLSSKQMLLILDNFEHLPGGANFIKNLLSAAPDLSIMVTSRTQLRLRGEKILSLSGLAYEDDGSEPTAATPIDHDAAQLFVTTAKQIVPELKFSPDDRTRIHEICRIVEGVPLAVELTAQWVNALPLEVIVGELKIGMARLETERQDLPDRHRNMQAVFTSSWQRLPESARRVLARASVFQGGFTLDAAITILGATNRTLSLLVNHSLLRFDRAGKRYHCHELLRQFSAAQLATNPDLEHQTRQKHLIYFYRLAEQGEQHLRGGDPIRWMKRLYQEKGNWQAAFEWGFENELETTAQLVIHLSLFWFSSGQMQWGQKLHEKLLDRQDELPEQVRGWVLTWYTAMIWVQGRLQDSKQLALEAYQLFQKINDPEGIIMSYHHQYVVAFYQGDLDAAAYYNEQAVDIARHAAAVHPFFLAVCLQTQSNRQMEAGQEAAAYRAASESYQLCQQHNNLFTGTYAMATLARLAIKRGEFVEAHALCREALAIAQDMNDPRMESIQYLVLGNIALAERNFTAAVDHLETAVTIANTTNNTDILDEAVMLLGRDAYTGIGEYALAFAALQRWADICIQLNNEANMASCLKKMADVHWRLNPGNRESVRWLAAASAWRSVTDALAEEFPDSRLLKKMQKQIAAGAFRENWEAGLLLSLHEGLAEATAA